MKRMFYLVLAALAIVTACQKEATENAPSVSFASAIPVTVDGTATLTLAVENYTGAEAVTVPVEFGGEAVLGEDYEVSAEAFVIGGASPVTTITVTPLVYGTDKSVTAKILPPDGFVAGRYASTAFSLSDQLGRFSFTSNTAAMTSSVTISARIYDDNDNVLRLQNGDEIEVAVNTEKSTAVEGVNFEFADDKKAVVFPAESNTGSVTLNFIGEVDENANKIYLVFTPTTKYGEGQYIEVEITIIGSAWDKLDGTWKIKEFITDKEYMMNDSGMYYSEEDMEGYPEFNENDAVTFDLENGIFSPAFQSAFKNYFIGDSVMVPGDELEMPLENVFNPEKAVLLLIDLDNVNRYFTAGETSADTHGYIGVRFITDEETQEELLDFYVLDYNPKSFFSNYDWMFGTDKPTAASPGMFLRVTFAKAE